jgi:hypothetical protein
LTEFGNTSSFENVDFVISVFDVPKHLFSFPISLFIIGVVQTFLFLFVAFLCCAIPLDLQPFLERFIFCFFVDFVTFIPVWIWLVRIVSYKKYFNKAPVRIATRQQVSNIMFIVWEFLWLSTFHYVLCSNFRSEFSCVNDSNGKLLTWLVLRILTLLFLFSMFRSISFPSWFPCL